MMRDDISDIKAMYDSALEREDSRLVRHELEYDLTWRYLDEYLPPEGRILEIGAASSTTTHAWPLTVSRPVTRASTSGARTELVTGKEPIFRGSTWSENMPCMIVSGSS